MEYSSGILFLNFISTILPNIKNLISYVKLKIQSKNLRCWVIDQHYISKPLTLWFIALTESDYACVWWINKQFFKKQKIILRVCLIVILGSVSSLSNT